MNTQELEEKLSHRSQSPLFARLASEYLAEGRGADAEELCRSGLLNFPNYPTASLIYARCFVQREDYVSALVQLQGALTALPDSSLLQKLSTEWKEKALEQTFFQLPPPEIFAEEQPAHGEPLNEVPPPEYIAPDVGVEASAAIEVSEALPPQAPREPLGAADQEEAGLDSGVAEPIEIQTVEEAGIVQHTGAVHPPVRGGRIVSKTLAEIYADQGAYQEAIIIYELLREQRPALEQECGQRIKELESKVLSRTTQ